MAFIRALLYSNVFVGIVLSFLATATYFVVPGLRLEWYVVVSVFLGSFALYSFHRLYKIDFIPASQLSGRHRWMLRHGNRIKIGMALAVFFAMLILPNYDAKDIVWLVPAAIVSVGYTVPFIPTEKKWWRLRDIPLAKPFIIALSVSYLTLGFPVFEQGDIIDVFTPKVLQLFFERMSYILAVTIPFEMRDIASDLDAGIETLATYLGFKSAKRAAYGMLLLWLILFSWRYIVPFNLPMLSAGLMLFALTALAIYNLHPMREELYYVLVFEGLIVLYSCLFICAGILQ